jgi:hypothetical protein
MMVESKPTFEHTSWYHVDSFFMNLVLAFFILEPSHGSRIQGLIFWAGV